MTQLAKGRLWVALCSIAALSACEEGASLFGTTTTTAPETTTTTTLVERDVEAPDVFQANENGLWDGRPSLGGVWVASTDATDPERVIIRNETNGKFVIGALFRRERELPGPKLQVSSDAGLAAQRAASVRIDETGGMPERPVRTGRLTRSAARVAAPPTIAIRRVVPSITAHSNLLKNRNRAI